MFGASSSTPSFSLGGSTQPASGFGNSAAPSGGLFGSQQKKPATGLFGQQPAAPSGGLFGSNAASSNTPALGGNTATSGGLFGQKPAGSTAFGSTAPTAPLSTPFGQKPAGFGAASGSTGLFGASNNTQTGNTSTSGGLFGNNSSTTSGFGSNTNTSGGLFGSNNNNNNSTNTGTSGGLFNKPATATSGGLFGQSNSGGLFSNTSNNTNTQSSGLFGSNNSNTQSGGLFGGQQNTQNQGGLFNNNSGGLFNQQQQQQQQPQTQLTPLTHVGDLPPEFKKELQDFDTYISTQSVIASTLNTDLPKHNQLVKSIPSDVKYLHTKILSIKQALRFDTDQLKSLKQVNDELTEDIGNVMQLIVQLSTPGTKLSSSFHLNEFFVKRITKYRELMDSYEKVINEGVQVTAGLEQSANETMGSIYSVVEVVRSQYALFMELCETLAQIHSEVGRLSQK